AELRKALLHSWHRIAAYEGDELVGVGRLVSDGVLYAVIFDMIVTPRLKGRGIGSEMVRRLKTHCRKNGIRDLLLFSAKGTKAFYEKHGFQARPEDAPGMILRRKPKK
ncbi:MAG: GNAT family N-acetyltransferase, partial [Planctomycetes bacterium]|nr:GNAT family N-acetyltransferase [Planctomycetota bacterium]